MGELLFIGLGLHDPSGLTLRGLEEARSAEVVYVERYTAHLSDEALTALERLVGKKIRTLHRHEVEDGREILQAAADHRVALLVPGDAMAATTHVDLRLRATAAKIPTRVVPGVSILTAAAGAIGLQAYKFGRTTTVPFPAPGFAPHSPLDAILGNLRAGLHTLVLLDLREDGTSLTPRDAFHALLKMAEDHGTSEFGPRTFAVVLSRVGAPDVRVTAGPISALADANVGPPMHCIVIPGSLHFLEKEALIAFAGAPHGV